MKREPKYTIVTARNGRRYAYIADQHVWDKDKQHSSAKGT